MVISTGARNVLSWGAWFKDLSVSLRSSREDDGTIIVIFVVEEFFKVGVALVQGSLSFAALQSRGRRHYNRPFDRSGEIF